MRARMQGRSISAPSLARRRASRVTVAALFAALTITPAWASVGKNDVGKMELKKGAVTAPKIAKRAVTTGKLDKQAVKAAKLADQAVTRAKLAEGAVDASRVEDGSLSGAKINQLSLDFSILQRRIAQACPPGQAIRAVAEGGEVACEQVQTTGSPTGPAGGDLAGTYPNPQIGAGAVGTAKLADLAVSNQKLAPNSVNSQKIADGSVGLADLASDSVNSAKIVDGSVSLADLADDSVNSQKVVDNSLTGADIDQSTLGFWSVAGNAGTDPATDFLGTTDDVPLDLRVNDAPALRLEPASDGTNQSPNVIGGIADNAVTDGVHSATIGGGGRRTAGDPSTANGVTDDGGTVSGGAGNQAGDDSGTTSDRPGATIGGGQSNTASNNQTTVGGGGNNTASGFQATVGGGDGNDATQTETTVAGGDNNTASGFGATVGGGFANTASGERATVSGGVGNTASGIFGTVPGGSSNTAAGVRAFAAGRQAKANDDGAFVWADNTGADIASTAANQFIARASGGFFLQNDSTLDDQGGFINTSTGAFLSDAGVWTDVSDRNEKEGFAEVEASEVLAKLAELPVRSWSYKAEPGVRHLGPVAQDFHAAFGLGADDRHIASLDANGVALAAIKGLNEANVQLSRELRVERRLRISQEREFEAGLAALERGGD